MVPGATAEGDTAIRQAIVHLHERILGRYDAADSDEVDRTFKLFAAIVTDAKARKGIDKREHCAGRKGRRTTRITQSGRGVPW